MVDAGPGGDCAGDGAGGLWMQRWASALRIVARGRRGGHALREWLVASGAHFLGLWVSGLVCALSVATAIDHMQLLTDEVEERLCPVVEETAVLRYGVLFFLSEFSPIPEKLLMQTQVGECMFVDDGSAARQFRVTTGSRMTLRGVGL